MVYKNRQDYKIATCFEDEERFLKLGYGSADIILSGKKPKEVEKKVVEPVKVEEIVKPKRKRRTKAEMIKDGDSK